MEVLLVIPARLASARFPEKPLVPLRGCDGQAVSLVERSWRAARAVQGIDRLVIATDDQRIARHCEGFGAEVVMTSSACRNGTERAAEVAALFPQYEIIVNFQGDAPLTPPWFVAPLLAAFDDADVAVSTPVLRCDPEAAAALRKDRTEGRVGGTTAVCARDGRALYFSKEVLPFGRAVSPLLHVGLYAYRRSALERYMRLPEGSLEAAEGLEQLRFLENGVPVQCIEVDARGRRLWEVNNPADVAIVESILSEQGMA